MRFLRYAHTIDVEVVKQLINLTSDLTLKSNTGDSIFSLTATNKNSSPQIMEIMKELSCDPNYLIINPKNNSKGRCFLVDYFKTF